MYAAIDAAVLPPLFEVLAAHMGSESSATAAGTVSSVRTKATPAAGQDSAQSPAAQPTRVERTADRGIDELGPRSQKAQGEPEAENSTTGEAVRQDTPSDARRGAAPALFSRGISSRLLSPDVKSLLERHLGREVGSRSDVVEVCVRSCAASDASTCTSAPAGDAVVPEGDGGSTVWLDCTCLYVNAGRYRNGPSAKYRNRLWRETEGELAGAAWSG